MQPQHLRHGQLVRHRDLDDEFFIVERFDGEYLGDGKGFKWRVWVRGVEEHTHIPFPAAVDELLAVLVN